MHVLPKRACLAAVSIIAATYGLDAAPAQATAPTDVVYTGQTDFLNHIESSYYLETFDTQPTTFVASGQVFSGSGYSYKAENALGFYGVKPDTSHPNDRALSAAQLAPITITFNTPVTAVGGNFFETNFNGQQQVPGSVVVTLSDGSTQPLTGTTDGPQPFVGFTSKTSIASLTLTASGGSNYATINNFIVGTAFVAGAPEPSEWAALGFTGLTVGGLLLRARRRKALAAD